MNICVFGAASNEIDKKFISAIEEMAEALAKKGHNLVYGAGNNGVMGASARGFVRGGGKVIGVIPEFFKETMAEVIKTDCDELIYTQTMQERKKTMEDLADVFIIAPGGIGTFDEFFEVLTLKQLGRHNKPIVVYNLFDYYSPLEAMLDNAIEGKFLTETCKEIYSFESELPSLIEYLESYEGKSFDVAELKKR